MSLSSMLDSFITLVDEELTFDIGRHEIPVARYMMYIVVTVICVALVPLMALVMLIRFLINPETYQ